MNRAVFPWKVVGVVLALTAAGCVTAPGGNEPSLGSQAQATSVAPEAAQVASLSIPADPALPKFVVLIKPFQYSASGQMSGGGSTGPAANQIVEGETVTSMSPDGAQIKTTISSTAGPDLGRGIAAQLRTALNGWPNITVLPPEAITPAGDGKFKCQLEPGEVGPFVIEGIITEYSETADASGKGGGVNTRPLGAVTAIAGALTGNRAVTATGAGFALVGPKFRNEKMKRTGMVGLDLSILDGRKARYVSNFSCQGSFTTVAAGSNFSMLGISTGKGDVAASSLGNATRAAMNDALQKICDGLKTVR